MNTTLLPNRAEYAEHSVTCGPEGLLNKCVMKRFVPFLASLAAFAACGPTTFMMDVEMRGPSKSGLMLGNKMISVVYLDNGDRADSLLLASMAEGFASELEKDYFSSEQAAGIFCLDRKPDADYASRDTLVNLLVETGADVTFVIGLDRMGASTVSSPVAVAAPSSPDSSFVSEVSTPVDMRVYAYDGLDRSDTVKVYTGNTVIRSAVYSNGKEGQEVLLSRVPSSMRDAGADTGRTAAGIFLSTWIDSRFPVIYYDFGEPGWLQAAQAAYEYRWKDAMDIWMALLDTKNMQKKACAEYNIALSCYLLGQNSLALEWLDMADRDFRIQPSVSLRRRISK